MRAAWSAAFVLCGAALAAQTAQPASSPPPAAPPPAAAKPVDPDWIFSFGASVIYFNEDGGLDTAPPPFLVSPYASFGWAALKSSFVSLLLHARLHLYGTDYSWSDAAARPYPAEIENRSAFVFGIWPGIEARALFRLSRVFLSAGAGLSADLRVVTTAFDLAQRDLDDARAQTGRIRAYFWEEGRFLYPSLSVAFDAPLTGPWLLGVACTAWLPVTGTGGLADWRLGFSLTVSRHFFKKEKKEKETPPSQQTPTPRPSSRQPDGTAG